jgi:hypothetical protein
MVGGRRLRVLARDGTVGHSEAVEEQPDAAALSPVLSSFSGWVWTADPAERNWSRGVSTARLLVGRGNLEVLPGRVGRFFQATPHVTYAWPVVVIEHHRPLLNVGVLIDVHGQLGRVMVRRGSRGRLRRALETAGFGVVQVTYWSWEAGKPVSVGELGAAIELVPPCVVARTGSG